jgi:hypothetical protein
LRLSQNEQVRWFNEGKPPTQKDLDEGGLILHPKARGYLLCPSCGRMLTAPEPETGDIDDPKPWLEAYAAGVGSPLELKYLQPFEKHGFHPQKQVPVSPSPSQPSISIADFAVLDWRLAIYVDGAAFHVGRRLRRDRFIRDRLRSGNPPWRVEELRAADLREGVTLVEGSKKT